MSQTLDFLKIWIEFGLLDQEELRFVWESLLYSSEAQQLLQRFQVVKLKPEHIQTFFNFFVETKPEVLSSSILDFITILVQ